MDSTLKMERQARNATSLKNAKHAVPAWIREIRSSLPAVVVIPANTPGWIKELAYAVDAEKQELLENESDANLALFALHSKMKARRTPKYMRADISSALIQARLGAKLHGITFEEALLCEYHAGMMTAATARFFNSLGALNG